MTDPPVLIALVLLSVALFISLCLNVIFCVRQTATLCKGKAKCCCTNIYTEESLPQDEEHNLYNHHHEQQENPIYGNISSDRRDSVEVCYEMMTLQHTRDHMTGADQFKPMLIDLLSKRKAVVTLDIVPLAPDLNYASLDLKMAKKRMKNNRHQQGHAQGRNRLEDELPVHLTPPVNAFLEVEADVDAHLPSRDTSTMVSHSSIYLNSQQIAQETEEMERERGVNMEREIVGWEGMRRRDDGRSREWKAEQQCKERKDGSDGSACTQLSEVEAVLNGTDRFISSFSCDSDQQD